MKRISLLFVLVFLIGLFASVSTAQPGIYTAINADGVNNLAKKILPGLIEQLRGTRFPDVYDGHHRLTNPHIPEIGLESFHMEISDDGIISLHITRFHVSVKFRYRYKRKLIPILTYVRATLSDANLNIQLKLWNDNGRFGLGVHAVHVDAGEASFEVTGKPIKEKFLNAVKSIFKSRMKSTVLGKVRDTLQDSIVEFGSNFVNNINLRHNFGDWGSIDFSLVNDIRYGHNSVIVGFNGDIQSVNDHSPSQLPRNELPFHPTDRPFSVGMDVFVFNSGFETFFKNQLFWLVANKADPRGYPGPKLETNEWAKSIPALKAKHANKDVRLQVRFSEAPVLRSTGGALHFHAVVFTHVEVGSGDNWENVFTLSTTLDTAVSVSLSNNAIVIQIQDVQTQFTVVNSTIGDLDLAVAIIQGLFQYSIDVAVPVINERLLPGLPLPVNGHMVISDASFALPKNGLVAAANIDFNF